MGFEPMDNGFAGRRIRHFAPVLNFPTSLLKKQNARLSIAGTGR